MSRKTTTITAAQATLPEAVPTAQRTLPGEIVYSFFDWVSDWWAGRRDAPLLRAMLAKDTQLAITPWMRGLRGGFLTAAGRDRRDTTALQAPVRDEAAAIIEQFHALDSRAEELKTAVSKAQDEPIDNKPTTSSEQNETPDQRLRRRQRELNARVVTARGNLAQHGQATDALLARFAQLAEVYAFHEATYNHRIEALRDFYTKRESVYLRHGLKGASHDGVPPVAPEIDLPEWPAPAFPSLADSVRA